MGFYRHSDPYKQTVGPSLRMIIDVGNWEQPGFILPSGQSGHPSSPYYKDQTELWRRGERVHLAYDNQATDQMLALVLAPPSPNFP
jgi:penicillin amidase